MPVAILLRVNALYVAGEPVDDQLVWRDTPVSWLWNLWNGDRVQFSNRRLDRVSANPLSVAVAQNLYGPTIEATVAFLGLGSSSDRPCYKQKQHLYSPTHKSFHMRGGTRCHAHLPRSCTFQISSRRSTACRGSDTHRILY